MIPIVGLTGGIGSGKSTVADAFAARSVPVVDTDRIAHQLTAPGGAAIESIREAFGAALIDAAGALDRHRMRRLVFADTAARARLEAILHPLIRAQAMAECAASRGPYLLLVVPLLVESGALRETMARVLVVDCEPQRQRERVMRRSGLSADEADAIIAAQATRAERLAAADDVIVNDGGLPELEAQVEALHRRYLQPGAFAERSAG